MDKWKDDNKYFICTRAYQDVLAKITSNNCVAVTGSSGSGKSAIVQHVSLLLHEENGYDVIIVSSPMELRNYYKPGMKTLFVVDDICGKFTANKGQIDDWCLMIDVVNQVITDDSCKMLISCRLQVYKDAKFLELEPFISCQCNITSKELCLTKEEKKTFLKTYLKLDNVELDITSKTNDMFPLLCKSYSTETTKHNIEKYFNKPNHAFKKELEALKFNGKRKLCALCLCLIFNNKLKERYFTNIENWFRRIVKDTCEYIGLASGTSAILLREELDTLDKTYVSKHDGIYAINHDQFFDCVASFLGPMMTKCLIDHAVSGFLRERFLWRTDIDTEEHLIENIIYLHDDFLSSYISRMISDWSKGNVSDVFYNLNMKSPSFRAEFLKSLDLNGIDKIEATKMSNMKDVFRDDFASGNTPLIIACLDGYVDLLNWLLIHKANVNACRNDGSSGLYMACQKQNVVVVKTLLEKNADVDLCTIEGVSPLGIACRFHGNLQIVSQLLEKNADCNKFRYKENNMTPLFMACQQKFISTAEELLNHGANPEICLHDGMSVLLFACQQKFIEIARLLIKHKANVNAEMRDGDTALFSVSRMGFEDLAELLLESGANPNKFLHSKEEIKKSLQDVNEFENEKQSWFEDVKDFGSARTNEYISTLSADNVFNVFAGSSPLHASSFMGHTKISKLLLKHISNVDIRKDDGTTPLFYACELGHINIVRVLLEKGADPNAARDDQCSPLTIAKVNGHTDVLSLMLHFVKQKNETVIYRRTSFCRTRLCRKHG